MSRVREKVRVGHRFRPLYFSLAAIDNYYHHRSSMVGEELQIVMICGRLFLIIGFREKGPRYAGRKHKGLEDGIKFNY